MTTLRAHGLEAGYAGRVVLRGLDLQLTSGDRVGLIGANGSGKTTLVRSLAGVLPARAGSVTIDGTPLAALDHRTRARRIAVVPQMFATPFAFTAREIVMLGRTPYVGAFGRPSRADRAAVERAMAATECFALAERPLTELSGGERQRVLIAMALAQEPDVLLLDEPTVHLDPAHQRATLDLVTRLARERGVLVLAVLHDLNLAAAMCDRVVLLDRGAIVADGAPADVLDDRTVARVFGSGLRVGTHEGVPFVLPRSH